MRALVTGFGPFPRMPRNPSAGVARAVAASPRLRLAGLDATAFVLTTAYAALAPELDPLLAQEPDIVLMIGVAGRSEKVRVETRASARRSTLFPDALGELPHRPRAGAKARSGAARRTRVNAGFALRCLRLRGLPARLSRDAGRYLCNAAYFRALSRPGPTLFLHIPKPPTPRPRRDVGRQPRNRRDAGRLVGARWRRTLATALVDILIGLRPEARRVVRPAAIR